MRRHSGNLVAAARDFDHHLRRTTDSATDLFYLVAAED
jgi:hypothetical protein